MLGSRSCAAELWHNRQETCASLNHVSYLTAAAQHMLMLPEWERGCFCKLENAFAAGCLLRGG